MTLKVYQVEVIAGQRPLNGLVASPYDTFTAHCFQCAPAMTAERAKQHATRELLGTGVIAWANVVACRRRPDIEVESEALLAEMVAVMRGDT